MQLLARIRMSIIQQYLESFSHFFMLDLRTTYNSVSPTDWLSLLNVKHTLKIILHKSYSWMCLIMAFLVIVNVTHFWVLHAHHKTNDSTLGMYDLNSSKVGPWKYWNILLLFFIMYNYHYNENAGLSIEILYEYHNNSSLHMALKSWANKCTTRALKWSCPFALNKIQCNAHPVHTDWKQRHFKYQNLISFFGGDRERLKHSVELPQLSI